MKNILTVEIVFCIIHCIEYDCPYHTDNSSNGFQERKNFVLQTNCSHIGNVLLQKKYQPGLAMSLHSTGIA